MRRIRLEMTTGHALTWQMLISGIVLLVAAWGTGQTDSLPGIDLPILNAIAYLVIPGSVIGFLALDYIYKNLPVGIASSYEYVSILTTAIAGYIFFDEEITLPTIIGGVIMLTGIFLIRHYERAVEKNGDYN